MKLLSFEANKIKNKRLLSALIIVPVLIVVTVFLARLFTTWYISVIIPEKLNFLIQ